MRSDHDGSISLHFTMQENSISLLDYITLTDLVTATPLHCCKAPLRTAKSGICEMMFCGDRCGVVQESMLTPSKLSKQAAPCYKGPSKTPRQDWTNISKV